MLNLRTQATILLTVPFPGENRSFSPLTPSEWGRFAKWLRANSLKPEDLVYGPLPTLLGELKDKNITGERLESLLGRSVALGLLIDKWSRAGLWVMTRADPDYPSRLKKRLEYVSPAVLFGCGNRELLSEGGLAVVGSRNAGQDDLEYSRQLGRHAAGNGHSIISGGARGVDEAAMLGALENKGTAVGVLANNLLRICTSPKYRGHISNDKLVLISSTNPEAGFDVGNAMQRNKYIYCLAEAAVVIHSGTKGGTWSGAQENLKKKWVPLWVKESSDIQSGNWKLIEATHVVRQLPDDLDRFPFESLFSPTLATPPLADSLPHGGLTLPPQAVPVAPKLDEITFYELFLNKLYSTCRDAPCGIDQLREKLDLRKAQLDDWLKKAEVEGKIEKLSRPVRYKIPQPRMFDE